MIRKHDAECVLIVYRHPGMSAQIGKRRERWNERIEWQEKLVDAPVQRIGVIVAPSGDAHPEVLLDALESRTEISLLNPGARRALRVQTAVQKRRMRRVDLAFDGLQPVALLNADRDVHLLLWDHVPLEVRQWRKIGLVRAHIGPDHSVTLLAGISLDPNTFLEAAANRLARHIRYGTGHIELPAVINASQSAILVARENQWGAPVRTCLVNQADAAFRIPESNQVFPEQPDTLRLAVNGQIG